MSSLSMQRGTLAKMRSTLKESAAVEYQLPLGDTLIPLNPLLGRRIHLSWAGAIHCTHCARKTKKSFNQGYCYPCFTRLASCDLCIMSPERCHYHEGTCREPTWGEQFCMTDHIVYLANSSAPKVGITRLSQIPTRWIDQGAVQALPLFRVQTRQQSGLVETAFKPYVSDKTSWQAMLKGEPEQVDLSALASSLCEQVEAQLTALQKIHGLQAIQRIESDSQQQLNYPVLEYPQKVKAHNLEKNPELEGTLQGIKGQYLILDTGVINIRKYTAFEVQFSVS